MISLTVLRVISIPSWFFARATSSRAPRQSRADIFIDSAFKIRRILSATPCWNRFMSAWRSSCRDGYGLRQNNRCTTGLHGLHGDQASVSERWKTPHARADLRTSCRGRADHERVGVRSGPPCRDQGGHSLRANRAERHAARQPAAVAARMLGVNYVLHRGLVRDRTAEGEARLKQALGQFLIGGIVRNFPLPILRFSRVELRVRTLRGEIGRAHV